MRRRKNTSASYCKISSSGHNKSPAMVSETAWTRKPESMPSNAGKEFEMTRSTRQSRVTVGFALAYLCAMVGCASHNNSSSTSVAPATMPRIATVDERYQSYNVEMLEVTGGNFWKPY